MDKRQRWTAALLAAMFAGLFLICQAANAAATEKLFLGYSATAGSMAPLWIAKDAGSFAKYGIDATLVYVEGGSTSAAALVSGQVPVSEMAAPSLIYSNLGGSDLVLIAGVVNVLAFQFMTVPAIASPAQLKGKKVGILKFGDATDTVSRLALKRLGLTPDKDVAIVQVGSQPARLAAMKSGLVQAGVFLPPITLRARELGFHTLIDLSNLNLAYQTTGLATTRKYIREHRGSVIRIMKGYVDGIHFYKTHKKESMRIIAKYMRTKDMEAVAAAYDFFGIKLLPKKPYPSLKGIKALLEQMARSDPKAVHAKPERFVDMSILKKLDTSGFIDALYRK